MSWRKPLWSRGLSHKILVRGAGIKSGDSNQWIRLLVRFPRMCCWALRLHSHEELRAYWSASLHSCLWRQYTYGVFCKMQLWTAKPSHRDLEFLLCYGILHFTSLSKLGVRHLLPNWYMGNNKISCRNTEAELLYMIWCNNCASSSWGSTGWPLNWHNTPYFCWCHLNYDGLLKLRIWSYKLAGRLFPFGDLEPEQNRTVTGGSWISHRW